MSRSLAHAVTPPWLRVPVRLLSLFMLVVVPIFMFLPWQQNVIGQGRVTAFQPNEREQIIDAPIGGRVSRWHVVEGSKVKAGQKLVTLADVDPKYVERLKEKLRATTAELDAAQREAIAYKNQEEALLSAQKLAVRAAGHKVTMAEQKIAAAQEKLRASEANLKTTRLNLSRMKQLVDEGLRSRRDLELAVLAQAKSETAVNQAKAGLSEARAQKTALGAEQIQKGAEFDAKIASADAYRRKANAQSEKIKKSLAELEVKLARQAAQEVVAPRDGIILKVLADQGGEVVKEGEALARLVPLTESRAIELWVDGNDAPLISGERRARVQFEGWPAVQFVGWPSAAVGTFGAKVAFVDAMGRKDGRFRVVLVPDPGDKPWPESRLLRQGVKAKGWVLLDEVSVGFELWRQFNGFPVSIDRDDDMHAGKAPQ